MPATGVLKFTPVDIWRRPFREILPRIYISMSSSCVQGYPIGRVKRIKGEEGEGEGCTTANLFAFRLVVLLSPQTACADTGCRYAQPRFPPGSDEQFIQWVHTNGLRVSSSSSSSRSGIKRERFFRITNADVTYNNGNGTWDLGLARFKVEDLSPSSRKDRKTVYLESFVHFAIFV